MGSLDVVTRFIADTAELEAGASKAAKSVEGFNVSSLASVAGPVAIAGAALAAGAAIVEMTKAASADAAEQAKLEQAIAAAGAATDTSTAAVNAAIAASQAKAFTDTDTRDALTSLVTATGDVTTATALLSTAQDVARFAGVDLATAADAIAKANAGQDGALRKLIPGLEKGATATDTIANAQKAAAGQADLFAKSTEGQMQVASDSFSELGETIGSAFLPLLEAILPPLGKLIGALGTLITAVLPIITPLITILGEAIGIVVDLVVKWLEWTIKVWQAIFGKLQPVIKGLTPVIEGMGKAIGGVVDFIKSLLDWIGRAIDAVGRFFDKLNVLKDFKMPSISLPSLPFSAALAPAGAGVSTRAAGARSAPSGGVTVNIYGGDPRRTEQAVRDAFRHWRATEGTTAPEREW